MGVRIDRFKKAFTGRVGDALLEDMRTSTHQLLSELHAMVDTLETLGLSNSPHLGTLAGFALGYKAVTKSYDDNATKYEDFKEIHDNAKAEKDLVRTKIRQAATGASASAQLLSGFVTGDTKPSDLRRALVQGLTHDPKLLEKLMALPHGAKAIDAAVASLGGKAGSDSDRAFVKQALVDRYGLTSLKGDLTAKNLPRLYEVIGMVPESHAKDNQWLANVALNNGDGGGDYTGGKLVLNCADPRHQDEDDAFDTDDADQVDPSWKPTGSYAKFDQTTLHEVGHAVDHQMGFMKGHMGDAAFGGWERIDTKKVAIAVDAEFAFVDDLKAEFPPAMLRLALLNALMGRVDTGWWAGQKSMAGNVPARDVLIQDPAVVHADQGRAQLPSPHDTMASGTLLSDAKFKTKLKGTDHRNILAEVLGLICGPDKVDAATAVDQVLTILASATDPPADTDWKRIMGHKGFQWCVQAKKKEQWKLGTSGARANCLGAFVYLLDDTWYRYAFSSRAKSISKYQFNKPGEWFAELYSAYYLGNMPASHPDHSWMENTVHPYKG